LFLTIHPFEYLELGRYVFIIGGSTLSDLGKVNPGLAFSNSNSAILLNAFQSSSHFFSTSSSAFLIPPSFIYISCIRASLRLKSIPVKTRLLFLMRF